MCSKPVEAGFSFPVTDDTVLDGRLKLFQPARGHRAGHDAILLASAAPASEHAIDLGAGAGTAGLALLARGIAERVTLIEIDEELAALARANAKRNGFAARADVIAGDVTEDTKLAGESFDLVLMNPPFNDMERHRLSPDLSRAKAHGAEPGGIERWIAAAHRLCKPNGSLVLIHRPESTLPILKSLDGRFGAIQIIPVFPKPEAAAIRSIVRAIKGRKTPATLLPGVTLSTTDGKPTDAAEKILRGGEALLRD